MKALTLAVLLGCLPALAAEEVPQKAPQPDRGEVATAVVLGPDGKPFTAEGGCWLRADTCVATGRELTRLRNENTALKVLVVVGGVLVAGGAGWALHAELTRK